MQTKNQLTFLTPKIHFPCAVQRGEELRDALVLQGMEPPSRSRGDTNVHLFQARKYFFAGEQFIHPPPKPKAVSNRSLVATMYSDALQVWKVWAELQRTLAPPIVLQNEGTDDQ